MTWPHGKAIAPSRTAVAHRRRATAPVLAAVLLTAGCGAARAAHPAPSAAQPPPSLNTSLVTAAGTWAVVPMGGSPAFWQLFRYQAAGSPGTRWSLVTPPGVADNGGLVLADLGGQSLLAGFRPSKDLVYSPLAATADGGKTWAPGILDASLADVPDALAAGAGGHMLALLKNGTVQQSASPTATSGWSQVASERVLAASSAGRACKLSALTAVAFSGPGTALLAGNCARPGMVGIFALADGTWHAAGPALPPSLAGEAVTALRLATTGGRTVALFVVGTGRTAALLAGWTSDGGAHWTLASTLGLAGPQVRSSGLGPGGALWVMLTGGRAETLSGPGGSWRALPALPAGTAALAMGAPGQFDALAVRGATLADWRLDLAAQPSQPSQPPLPATEWHNAQDIKVPIQFGSSG